MALKRPCPRCQGMLIMVDQRHGIPAHLSCLNCGRYVEKAVPVFMPEFPPPTNQMLSSKYHQLPPDITRDEKRLRNTEAQRKYRASIAGTESSS